MDVKTCINKVHDSDKFSSANTTVTVSQEQQMHFVYVHMVFQHLMNILGSINFQATGQNCPGKFPNTALHHSGTNVDPG
jgi:hypothetical protein